ncbi:MAG: carbohydrate kinase [Ekhidna sp.]|nr:carbohydrate kinase [Ekhidna sp.]MBC6409025.1 carbohydrate kinase [Ekhidna sp.]MBC6426015.1 carbohydrate kinase [Ekhidna sp.]
MDLKDTSVLCFGEVLFDLFPDGAKPGGAPMNVAVHLQNLGVSSGVISKVGNDEPGKELIEFLNNKGVNTELIQMDTSRDTGTVCVSVDKNDEPIYTIVEKAAWDFIDDSFLKSELNPKYIVHGSLVCRSVDSNNSLQKLLKNTKAKVVFDLNVRSPYCNKSVIGKLMKTANIVKMNREEFKMLKEWFHIKTPDEQDDMKTLKALYPNLEIIIVTKGGQGAIAWKDGKTESVPVMKVDVVDTVGSGDAFLGAFISGIDLGRSLKEALQFASATGSFVAGKAGANPEYKEEDVLNLALTGSVT